MEQSNREHFEHEYVCCKEQLENIREKYQIEMDKLNGKLEATARNAHDSQHDLNSIRETIQETEERRTTIYDKQLDSVKTERDNITQLYESVVEESKTEADTIDMFISKYRESELQL